MVKKLYVMRRAAKTQEKLSTVPGGGDAGAPFECGNIDGTHNLIGHCVRPHQKAFTCTETLKSLKIPPQSVSVPRSGGSRGLQIFETRMLRK